MFLLEVPYAEKDQAKALGARWHPEKKKWYVPSGKSATPFEKWLPTPLDAAGAASPRSGGTKPRVESAANQKLMQGTVITGKLYFDTGHGCNPFVECDECSEALREKGWLKQ